MKLLPDSIRTRTVFVLLVGLTVSHIGSTLVYSTDRDQALVAATEQSFADKLAVLAVLIDNAPPTVRPQVAAAISSPDLEVSWGPASAVPPAHTDSQPYGLIQRSLGAHFGRLDDSNLHVVLSSAPPPAAAGHLLHGLPNGQVLQVAVGLTDASWINFRQHLPGAVNSWSLNSLLSTLVMVAATLVLSCWATGWITAPLAGFARAAERLGMDVGAPPLPEDGPSEVRAAARAFNQMQRRIRSFVDDRLQLLAAISHDLRTPITRLRLRTEQLPVAPEPQAKMLADLDEMERMVASSLAFAKDEATSEPRQAIDLSALLGAICDEASDAGQDAEFAWDGRLVYRGRPLALKRLFTNLVENAVRYGGRAKVSAVRQTSGVRVLVEDEGPGIPEAQFEAVFKPFFRLEQSRNRRTGGMGLGLANTRTIARAHGGDVSLENRVEGGLRAIVSLPDDSGATATEEPSA